MDKTAVNDTLTYELFLSIKKGLSIDPYNYKLYETLGTYYSLKGNQKQAYICLSQAKFYCTDVADRSSIHAALLDLKTRGYSVPKTAIIILSWNLKDFTIQCINSIRQTTSDEDREIIVVDNGSTDGSAEWLKEQTDIIYQLNLDNHGFPRGCNEGIALASEDSDIFLLNNDTVLPPNALFWLKIGLYENESVGATGSRSNYVSNFQAIEEQFSTPAEVIDFAVKANIPMPYPYEPKMYLVGFALLLKRSVLNLVGLLDEQFSPGNSEDVDICLRIRQAGYDTVLCYNSVILHFGSQSFQKLGDEFKAIMLDNIDKISDKYHLDIRKLCTPHTELSDNYLSHLSDPVCVLVIGDGIGATLAWCKYHSSDIKLYGIELASEATDISCSIQNVTVSPGTPNDAKFPFEENSFDFCFIVSNGEVPFDSKVLEDKLRSYLKPDGKTIISSMK